MPVTVDTTDLSFARDLLERSGVNDLLPKSAFIDSVRANWMSISSGIANIDLTSYRVRPPSLVYVPKSRKGYRVSHNLELQDFLVVSALMHQLAPAIESYRDPIENLRVFSNRVSPSQGSLFSKDGYAKFQEQSLALSSSGAYEYVLCIDIVDFYNQLSTHRVENSLQEAGISRETSKCVEDMLLSLNLNSSRGITVGQEFSSLLAECAITLVDSWLIKRNITYTRYVDDIRLFCRNWGEVIQLMHDLPTLLNQDTLKLCLNDEKTRTYTCENFSSLESFDPQKRQDSLRYKHYRLKASEALEMLREVYDEKYSSPIEDEDDLPSSVKQVVMTESLRQAIVELFDEAIAGEEPDPSIVRHLLTVCTAKRINAILGRVIYYLEWLTPHFRHVIQYLRANAQSLTASERNEFERWVNGSQRCKLPFTRLWLADLFMSTPHVLPGNSAPSVLDSWGATNLTYRFMSAQLTNDLTVIREHKMSWQGMGREERRWLLFASHVLPASERAAFWKEVEEQGDLIDRSIIFWRKGMAR